MLSYVNPGTALLALAAAASVFLSGLLIYALLCVIAMRAQLRTIALELHGIRAVLRPPHA
jgi:hypothetical protein